MNVHRDLLVSGALPPTAGFRVSIGVNVAMAMVLVDYALYGSRPPEPWARQLAEALPPSARLDLATIHAVLVHGLALRDAFVAEDDPSSWEALRARVRAWDATRWRGLIVDGCASNIAYAGGRVPAGWDASEEGFLGTVDAVAAEWTAGDRARLRRLVADPARFGETVVGLLDALWAAGVGDAWERDRAGLEAAAREGVSAVEAARGLPLPALVSRVVGLHPPTDWSEGWDGISRLMFLPCIGMGSLLARTRLGVLAAVCFAPGASRARAGAASAAQEDNQHLGAALHSLEAAVRTGVWGALRGHGEMYAGQIAEVLGAGQSAVSRVMVPLEEAGLVRVRRVGPAKFYTIDDGALGRLLLALGPQPPPERAGTTGTIP